MTVVVFGSINMDLVVQAPNLPTPGQTLRGQTFFTVSGGKGANQAVASARLGANTRMVGCVGRDVFGQTLRQSLHSYGVDVTYVTNHDGPSGVIRKRLLPRCDQSPAPEVLARYRAAPSSDGDTGWPGPTFNGREDRSHTLRMP